MFTGDEKSDRVVQIYRTPRKQVETRKIPLRESRPLIVELYHGKERKVFYLIRGIISLMTHKPFRGGRLTVDLRR